MPNGFASLAALNYLERSARDRLVRARTSGVTRSLYRRRPDIPVRGDLEAIAREREAERRREFQAAEAEKQREFAAQQAEEARAARNEEAEREYSRKTAAETAKAEVAMRFQSTESEKMRTHATKEGEKTRASAEKRTLQPLHTKAELEAQKKSDEDEKRYQAYLGIATQDFNDLTHGSEAFSKAQSWARNMADSGMSVKDWQKQQAETRKAELEVQAKDQKAQHDAMLAVFNNENVSREQRKAAGQVLGLRLKEPDKTAAEKKDEAEGRKDVVAWRKGELELPVATEKPEKYEVDYISSQSDAVLRDWIERAIQARDLANAKLYNDALKKRGLFSQGFF